MQTSAKKEEKKEEKEEKGGIEEEKEEKRKKRVSIFSHLLSSSSSSTYINVPHVQRAIKRRRAHMDIVREQTSTFDAAGREGDGERRRGREGELFLEFEDVGCTARLHAPHRYRVVSSECPHLYSLLLSSSPLSSPLLSSLSFFFFLFLFCWLLVAYLIGLWDSNDNSDLIRVAHLLRGDFLERLDRKSK